MKYVEEFDDTFAEGARWALAQVWAVSDHTSVGHPEEETTHVMSSEVAYFAHAAKADVHSIFADRHATHPRLRTRPSDDLLFQTRVQGFDEGVASVVVAASALRPTKEN